MIGRTPEYLGKKIQAREVKLAGLGSLVMPMIVLILTAIAVSVARGPRRPAQPRPARLHRDPLRPDLSGQQQRLGICWAQRQHPVLQHHRRHRHAHWAVRHHDPGTGAGRTLAAKGAVAESLGTFRTDNGMFVGLVIGVIVIIGGLTFFPAVSLGPIVEQLIHTKFF